jgi:hypothetical protein
MILETAGSAGQGTLFKRRELIFSRWRRGSFFRTEPADAVELFAEDALMERWTPALHQPRSGHHVCGSARGESDAERRRFAG